MRGPVSIALPALVLAVALAPAPAAQERPGAGRPASGPRDAAPGREPSGEALRKALERARRWLDRLHVDAAQLQRSGVKGKKKVGEILAAYLDLYRAEEDEGERSSILARVRGIAAQTVGPSWHNLSSCDERELRQNSMSYLRVLRLMEDFGLETEGYRRELATAAPRLAEHVASRGAWQRAVFASYYDRFGMKRPPALERAEEEKGIVARRIPAGSHTILTAYQLTHQVFAAFDYGHDAGQSRFGREDLEYLRNVLPALAASTREAGQADLLAEILSSMAYLGMRHDPAWMEGMIWLLEAQQADGSWGSYPKSVHGPWADQKLTLHTTQVAIQALVAARPGGP